MRRLWLALLGLLLFVIVAPLAAAISDNLVSCWALDSDGGSPPALVLTDSAASGNTLTDHNTVALGTGLVGSGSGDFESSSTQSLSHASNASLVMGDIDFTICATVKIESEVTGEIVAKNDLVVGEYQLDHPASSQFRFIVTDAVNVPYVAQVGGAAPALATRYFVCGWHDATANTVNISSNDGVVVSASTGGAAPFSGTAALSLGSMSDAASFPFDGLIDEVAIWKRVITAAEITDLYNGGSGRACSYIVPAAAPSRPCCLGVF